MPAQQDPQKQPATGRARANAKARNTASAQDPRAPEETELEADDDASERDEDLEQATLLLTLAQMDSEAAAAYETTAALVTSEEVRSQLLQFANDHRRHISDIGRLLAKRGVEPSIAAPPPELSLFAIMSRAMVPLGDEAALMALHISEEFTNAAYSTMLDVVTDVEASALLQRNFEDEQRHIDWLSLHASIEAEETP